MEVIRSYLISSICHPIASFLSVLSSPLPSPSPLSLSLQFSPCHHHRVAHQSWSVLRSPDAAAVPHRSLAFSLFLPRARSTKHPSYCFPNLSITLPLIHSDDIHHLSLPPTPRLHDPPLTTNDTTFAHQPLAASQLTSAAASANNREGRLHRPVQFCIASHNHPQS